MATAEASLVEYIRNPELFASKFLFIKTKPDATGVARLVNLTFNRMQKDYCQKRSHRDIIVKARQLGFSTGLLGMNYHKVSTIPNTELAVITHKDEASDYLMEVIRRFNANIPFELSIPKDNEDVITFEFRDPNNPKHVQTSAIYVGTAGGSIFGRAYSFTIIHMTETAHWEAKKTETILSGVVNSVPATGWITNESTPNGRAGYFYELYQQAKAKQSSYKNYFYPWWWSDDYTLQPNSDLLIAEDKEPKLSEEETYLVQVHGLNFNQILWRRWKYRELDAVRKDLFRQEFAENDTDCWLVAENAHFDPAAIYRLIKLKIAPMSHNLDSFYTIWKLPQGNNSYVIGVDVGEGLQDGDFSVGVVLNAKTNEHVATLRGRIPVDMFYDKLKKLAKLYNTATVAIERNVGQGLIELFKRDYYPNLYYQYNYNNVDSEKTGRAGFLTTGASRKAIIDWMKALLDNGGFITYDETLINEMLEFQRIDGKPQAPAGGHDDSLFAAMIAAYVREQIPLYESFEPSFSGGKSSVSYMP